ncbi:MAG TPA: hypothetical protein VNE86_02745 [Nitrososphaerales archaeon]|nr:hypothetical protein [Nitrososphaerales archaeon]
MLEEIRKDIVATFLLQKSTLTEVQLDTILASDREGNLDFKRGLREKGRVSKGSFARTLNQGQYNVESSIYTLFLLAYLDLVPQESLTQFSRNVRMLAQLKNAEAKRDDLLRVIGAMREFVNDFARKRKVIL